MATVTVRYIVDDVDDVDAAIDFYCRHLGFRELMHPAATFAMLVRDDLRLALSAPSAQGVAGSRCQTGPTQPGWVEPVLAGGL